MKLGIDPKVDYAFKRMCGMPETTPILISLLESILGFEIHGLELLNPFLEKEHSLDKLSVLDIKARDTAGRLYNIEIQMIAYRELIPRFLYYWSKLYASQLIEGDEYGKLCPTISIFLVNDIVVAETEVYHHPIHLQNIRTNQRFSSHLELHLIEISKFRKSLSELIAPLDQWVYFLKHAEELDPTASPPELKVLEISQALKELYKMSQSYLEREAYEARLKAQRDELSLRKSSERLEAEGRRMEAEARRMEAEARRIEADARRIEVEARRIEVEALQREAEARKLEADSFQREAEARKLDAESFQREAEARKLEAESFQRVAEMHRELVELNQKIEIIDAINRKRILRQEVMFPIQDLKQLSIHELQRQLDELS